MVSLMREDSRKCKLYVCAASLAAIGILIYLMTESKNTTDSVDDVDESCEGYWDPPEWCLYQRGREPHTKYGCPQDVPVCEDWSSCPGAAYLGSLKNPSHHNGLSSRVDWLAKLNKLEDEHAKIVRYRGIAFSRLKDMDPVGNAEFSIGKKCWPDGYRRHYLEEHKLVPSERFFYWVLDIDTTVLPTVPPNKK